MRRVAALVSTGVVAASLIAPLSLAAPASAQSPSPSLIMSVTGSTPWSPVPSATQHALTITVSLRNPSAAAVTHVQLQAGRGDPVSSQSALDTSLASHKLPSGLLPVPARPAVHSDFAVPAGATVSAVFRTTTTTSPPYDGLCLCANAVYPIYVSATSSRTGTVLGFARTYLTSTDGGTDHKQHALHKLDVAWVWPLIDVPHRLTDARVFTDRSLPAELVPTTGRLARALQVVRDVGPNHPITLVLDPELIDELAILSTGDFDYQDSSGKTVPGAADPAAGTWLAQLREVLSYSDVTPEFTPYADPDVRTLAANHLSWHATMPPTMLARVERALGLSSISTTLSWPPGGVVDTRTLDRIAADGSTSVLLGGTTVRPSTVGGLPASTARLRTASGPVSAALTSPAMQDDVAAGIRYGDAGNLSHLPALLAELAVRADTVPYDSRVAFLSAPRYVDPDVSAADTLIRETASSPISVPSSVRFALEQGQLGAGRAHLRPVPGSTPELSPPVLGLAHRFATSLPALQALLTGPGQNATVLPLLTGLSRGLQRVESAAYLSSSTTGTPAGGAGLAGRLRRQVDALLGGVYIVRPESSRRAYSYTLASSNSPLPITVDNTLPYRVFVHIEVGTVGGLPGLTTTDLGTRSVAPNSKQTFRVPAHVQRSGRIALTATLSTPGREFVLGPRVSLTVHSTVFGTIGIVITVVAAIVLFLALAVRYIRRLQRLRSKRRASAGGHRVPARIGS